MDVLKISTDNFKKEVLEESKTVVIDFYADWCGPCKMLSPVVEAVANEKENTKFVKINVDEAQELAVQYNIMSIPTLVVIKEGKEVNRTVGFIDKSELLKLIEE